MRRAQSAGKVSREGNNTLWDTGRQLRPRLQPHHKPSVSASVQKERLRIVLARPMCVQVEQQAEQQRLAGLLRLARHRILALYVQLHAMSRRVSYGQDPTAWHAESCHQRVPYLEIKWMWEKQTYRT
eukprot:365289-Chlamydomonas_euryale.AAC.26